MNSEKKMGLTMEAIEPIILESHTLSIGVIHIYDSHTFEVIVREGEILASDIESYFEFVDSKLSSPHKILINKVNSYSYSFDALQVLPSGKAKKLYAVLANTKSKRYSFDTTLSFLSSSNYQFFSHKEDALNWLLQFPIERIE